MKNLMSTFGRVDTMKQFSVTKDANIDGGVEYVVDYSCKSFRLKGTFTLENMSDPIPNIKGKGKVKFGNITLKDSTIVMFKNKTLVNDGVGWREIPNSALLVTTMKLIQHNNHHENINRKPSQ